MAKKPTAADELRELCRRVLFRLVRVDVSSGGRRTFTQKEIAEQLELSQASASRVVSGKRRLSVSRCLKLQAHLIENDLLLQEEKAETARILGLATDILTADTVLNASVTEPPVVVTSRLDKAIEALRYPLYDVVTKLPPDQGAALLGRFQELAKMATEIQEAISVHSDND